MLNFCLFGLIHWLHKVVLISKRRCTLNMVAHGAAHTRVCRIFLHVHVEFAESVCNLQFNLSFCFKEKPVVTLMFWNCEHPMGSAAWALDHNPCHTRQAQNIHYVVTKRAYWSKHTDRLSSAKTQEPPPPPFFFCLLS